MVQGLQHGLVVAGESLVCHQRLRLRQQKQRRQAGLLGWVPHPRTPAARTWYAELLSDYFARNFTMSLLANCRPGGVAAPPVWTALHSRSDAALCPADTLALRSKPCQVACLVWSPVPSLWLRAPIRVWLQLQATGYNHVEACCELKPSFMQNCHFSHFRHFRMVLY